MATPGDRIPDPADILTEAELESVRFAQDLYTAQAKVAAANLAATLELDSQTRDQLIGALSLRLVGVEWEELQTISLRIDEINMILSGVERATETAPSLGLVQPAQELPELGGEPGDAEHEDAPEETSETNVDNTTPLSSQQRSWLARLYSSEEIELIDKMSDHQREGLLENILEIYSRLKIARLTPAGRQRNAEYVRRFFQGQSYKEIADEFGTSNSLVWGALSVMADGIKKRAESGELEALIQEAASRAAETDAADEDQPPDAQELTDETEDERKPEDDEEKILPLTHDQKIWLEKLLTARQLEQFMNMPVGRRMDTIRQLLDAYKSAEKVRGEQYEKRGQRAEQVLGLMSGEDISDIAEREGASRNTVYMRYHLAAQSIWKIVTPEGIAEIFDKAEDGTADEIDIPAPEVDEPVVLTKEQERWFNGLFDDNDVTQSINELTAGQQKHLAEKLSHWLYPAIVRRWKPEASRSRVAAMVDFVSGTPISEIAMARGISEEAVRDILYHARSRLSAVTTQEILLSLVKEAQEFTPQKNGDS